MLGGEGGGGEKDSRFLFVVILLTLLLLLRPLNSLMELHDVITVIVAASGCYFISFK